MQHNLFKDKDVLFATIFVFAFMGLLGLSVVHIPQLDPIHLSFEDLEITDMVYQHRSQRSEGSANSPVVIVGIGNNRTEIAEQLEVINSFSPKAVGLDAYFLTPKEPEIDSTLLAAFSHTKNLVIGSILETDEESGHMKMVRSFSPVEKYSYNGFVNFVGEENKTIRLFKPHIDEQGIDANSFATELVRLTDKEKYDKLVSRGNKVEFINYKKSPAQYIPVLSYDEITRDNAALEILRNKIVIIGAIDFSDLHDLHFTPMNSRISGRSKPDMPGAFIHANTVEMILEGKYINKIPTWVVFVFSVLLTYVCVAFYTRYYVENHIWYHLVAKLTQFAFFFFFIFLEIVVLNQFNLRFSDKIILVPIILSVDLLYFYDAFVKFLHRKYGYKTYFLQGGH